jgi:1,2-phenylacetyl-CoA epoxidase PaaB subunit
MALLLARDTFFRHEEGVDLAVSRGPDFFPLGQPELLEHATDKSYRLQRGYTALGAVVQRRRPQDLRVLNEDHR